MRRSFAISILLALTACSGVRGVEYSILNPAPIPPERTVALDVVLPEGETDELWLAAERKIHAKLALELEERGNFQRVLHAGEPADYNMTVRVADVTIDRPKSEQEQVYTDDKLVKAVTALANVANAAAAAKLPDQVRNVKVYAKLAAQDSGREILAFHAQGANGRTDATVSEIVERIIAGVSCYGEDCA